MTDIEKQARELVESDAWGGFTNIEKQALGLIKNGTWREVTSVNLGIMTMAFGASIERHKEFRQEVSEMLEAYKARWIKSPRTVKKFDGHFSFLIIPKPVDPLVEVLKDADDMVRVPDAPSYPDAIRAALAKRGLEIKEVANG